MDRNKINERLELTLRPAKPPTLEDVLEEVSRRGDVMKNLLQRAHGQAKEKLVYAAAGAPFVAGLTDVGEKTAERFRALAERHERWKMEEKVINEVINAPLRGKTSQSRRPYEALLELTRSANLPKLHEELGEALAEPLVKLKEALKKVKDGAKKDAAVVAALVLYKTLINNAEAYGEWAELHRWARGQVKEQEFTVVASKIGEIHKAQKRLEEVAEEVRRELNTVLTLYSQKRDLYEKLKPLLEVDVKKAEGLAVARRDELSDYSNANMGTKVYAALLSIARGGIYGHAAMFLAGEGALADIVLLTPRGAYEKAKGIAERRGEAVDPSYSGRRGRSVGQPSWEDRAASALLRYLVGRTVSEDLVFRRVEGGFEVFRTYGGVGARIDVLKIGETTALSKADEEKLKRFVEEAKTTAPDFSGFDKAPQYLEWRATDVTTVKRQIAAGTVHSWQLRWYFGLLGKEKSFRGSASFTKEGIKLIVTAYWPREREDQILKESKWLESLLNQQVESWRELVDAINWSWVVEKVEKLTDELKPWIGPEKMDDAEREGLTRRMLGELALLVHFAEARRGKNDSRWREERIKMLAKEVEDLSNGRIAGEYAERLAHAIIYYAEGRKKRAEKRINELAQELTGALKEDVERIKGEVWGIVERILSGEDPYVYCLAKDCARDEVVRKFIAPALELIMLDKARNKEFDREEDLLLFGEMYATAVVGDGSVGPREVDMVVGGELGGGAVLLRLATLHLLNQLLPKELTFNVRVYIGEGRYYRIAATGEDAARFTRLLAVSAPSAGGEYLSPKFKEFMEEAQVEVRVDNIRETERGAVADLIISAGGIAVKYNVYLRDRAIELYFESKDRSRVELAAHLLRLAGVNAEVSKVGDRGVWRVRAYTDKLAAGREELRKVIAEAVRKAVENDGVDADKAERWLKKLERGLTLWEGWPKFYVGLPASGGLEISFKSTDPKSIEQVAQRLKEMGLEEERHFTVKMPEGGKAGYVYILKDGLAYAAWLSENGEGKQQRELAAAFVELILQRAKNACGNAERCPVYEKVKEIVEKGKAWGSLTLNESEFEKKVEVNGREYVVKVKGGEAIEEEQNGKTLLRIKIKVEVGRVEGEHVVDRAEREYEITYGRYGRNNAALGYAYARGDTPKDREADAERLAAMIETLTGVKPRIRRKSDGRIEIICGRKHLDGFMRYKELADTIKKWLEKTSRQRPTH